MKCQFVEEIRCGERTCASVSGVFCEHLGTKCFGQIPICLRFTSTDPDGVRNFTELEDELGWVQRCPECLRCFKEVG
jgi:hypothetical protein